MSNPNCLHCQIGALLEERKAAASVPALRALLVVATEVINRFPLEQRALLLAGACATLAKNIDGVEASVIADDIIEAPTKLHS